MLHTGLRVNLPEPQSPSLQERKTLMCPEMPHHTGSPCRVADIDVHVAQEDPAIDIEPFMLAGLANTVVSASLSRSMQAMAAMKLHSAALPTSVLFAIEEFHLPAVTQPLTAPDIASFWVLETGVDEVASKTESLISQLCPSDRDRVSKYRSVKDRTHSLASILLQRSLIRSALQVHDGEYQILRTAENKPYVCLGPRNAEKNHWNYNVSHQGKFACIASHRYALIGVDIVEVKLRPTWQKGVPAYIHLFGDQFTTGEVERMLRQTTPDEQLTHFFINWSLKESFIKAIGRGLYFDLTNIDFAIHYSESEGSLKRGTARVKLNLDWLDTWCFEFRCLDATHIVSVATGPIHDAADSFVDSLSAPTDVKFPVGAGAAAFCVADILQFVTLSQLLATEQRPSSTEALLF